MDETKTVERLRELSQRLDKRYLTLAQAMDIYTLFQRMPRKPKRLLEIGTYCGTGAALLGAMVEPWGGHVTTVDLPWTGQPNQHFTTLTEDQLALAGVTNVTVVRREDGAEGWLLDHVHEGGQPLDFVYIDGGHLWANTCAQFAAAYAAVRHGGWIVMDDTANKRCPEVGDCWRTVVPAIVRPEHRRQKGQLGFAMVYRPGGNA